VGIQAVLSGATATDVWETTGVPLYETLGLYRDYRIRSRGAPLTVLPIR
jgi:hypothetical protein